MSFGEKIRELREEKELSQQDLGAKVGMTQRRVSYIENGKYEPSLDDIRELCWFFDVSADYLLGLPQKLKWPQR